MLQLIVILALSILVAQGDVIEAPVNPIDYLQNPSQLEWQKIDTEHFELIFPKEAAVSAQRVAHLLEKAYPFVSRSQEVMPPKISLVLQNQSTQSNGFVTLAPRRSEWYLTPALDPELTNTEWLKTLSVHEFRHVVQFEKSKRGFNKFLYVILGEIGQALGIGLTMPPWYLEGDAVGIETALTRGGRGRLPLFERDLRTLLLSGKKYDYDKAHLGSYEDYIPNHYVYGYFYTTYLRNTYGDLFLSKIANNAADMSWNPLSFYVLTGRMTGKSFDNFYRTTMKDLIAQWKAKADRLTPTPYEIQNVSKKHGWTNYFYPQVSSKGEIVALKKGLSYIDRFVSINGKEEKTLFYPGPLMNEYPFKVRNDRLAFIEYEIDPRWGLRDFSRLKVWDLKKEEFILDKRKTKWRLAVLNDTGSRLAMSEWNTKQEQFIVTLDVDDKNLQHYPYPSEKVITSIDWLNEAELVMVVKDHFELKSLVKYNLLTHQEEVLLSGPQNLGFVAVEEGHIFFESPESGIDNIYVVEGKSKRQITSALFGAYAPEIKDHKLLYNDYTADGMNVVSKSHAWEEEQNSSDSFIPFYEKFAAAEKFKELESDYLKKENYKVEKYSQVKKAINVHSWLLLAPPLSNSIILQAYSRDILNKFATSVGGAYNLNEHTTQAFVAATWSHLYPVLDLRAIYGGRRENVITGGRKVEDRWEEGTAEASLQVPWKKISGRFVHNFSVRGFSKLIKVTNKISRDRADVNDGALFSPGAEFNYSYLSRMARRDLYPSLGFLLTGHFEEGRDITGVNQRGSIRNLDSRLYLPGLWYHHSFYQQLAYEKQRDSLYQYASYVYYPRGTRSVFLEEFVKYSGNYTLPLLTPDAHLSSYIYLKRLSLNLFYDSLRGRFRQFNYQASSAGWEVLLETHLLRIFLPITWGVRGSYVIQGAEKKENYEIFLQQALGVF
jgi:hypothetical protein